MRPQTKENLGALGIMVGVLMIAFVFLAIHFGIKSPPANPTNTLNWQPETINSADVSVIIINEVKDNPHTYEVAELVASSTLNDGEYELPHTLLPGQHVQIGCAGFNGAECRAQVF